MDLFNKLESAFTKMTKVQKLKIITIERLFAYELQLKIHNASKAKTH